MSKQCTTALNKQKIYFDLTPPRPESSLQRVAGDLVKFTREYGGILVSQYPLIQALTNHVVSWVKWESTMEPFILPKQLLLLTVDSLNTAWLVMHSPYLKYLRERRTDGDCHAADVKQNLCHLLCWACLHNCYHLYTQDIDTVGTHTPAAYSDVANTTAISCTVTTHDLTVLPGCLL